MLDVKKDSVVIANGSRAETQTCFVLASSGMRNHGGTHTLLSPGINELARANIKQRTLAVARNKTERSKKLDRIRSKQTIGRRWQDNVDYDNDDIAESTYLIALDESAVLHAPDVQMSGERSAHQVVA